MASLHPTNAEFHFGSCFLVMSFRYDVARDHIAEFLIFRSSAPSFWFSLNMSYNPPCHRQNGGCGSGGGSGGGGGGGGDGNSDGDRDRDWDGNGNDNAMVTVATTMAMMAMMASMVSMVMIMMMATMATAAATAVM